ncbi:MAG: DUF5360 family protein [Pseudomonadota bacterium]
MSRSLMTWILITDTVFILYWTMAALLEFGLLSIDPNLMYADYGLPRVVAWNWSFFPLDIIFSLIGFAAVSASRRGEPIWRPLAIISLTLTMTAGGMAVSYWAILWEFDPAWFLPNFGLVIWPLFFMPRLVRESALPAT